MVVEGKFSVSFGPKLRLRLLIWPWTKLNNMMILNNLIFFFFFTGNAALAKQKILSIFHHCANVHEFPSFTLFKKCQHDHIGEARPWIKAGKLWEL